MTRKVLRSIEHDGGAAGSHVIQDGFTKLERKTGLESKVEVAEPDGNVFHVAEGMRTNSSRKRPRSKKRSYDYYMEEEKEEKYTWTRPGSARSTTSVVSVSRTLPKVEDILADPELFPRRSETEQNGNKKTKISIDEESLPKLELPSILLDHVKEKEEKAMTKKRPPPPPMEQKSPIFNSISPRMRKKIERIPKPSGEERARLVALEEKFLALLKDEEIVDVDNGNGLYGKLWKQRKPDLTVETKVESVIRKRENGEYKSPTNQERSPGISPKPVMKSPKTGATRKSQKGKKTKHQVDSTEKRFRKSQERMERYNSKIADVVDEIQQMLPNDALFKHRLKMRNNKRTVEVITKLLKRFQLNHLLPSWNQWKLALDQLRREERVNCARKIQRCYIRHLGKMELKYRLEQVIKQKTTIETKLSMAIATRKAGALKIQKAIRGWFARTVLLLKQQEVRAAITVQMAWRAKKSRVLRFMLHAKDTNRHRCARDIQRLFRGYRGRFKARLMRKIRLVQEKELQKVKHKMMVQARLKRVGAAVIVQAWWRALQQRWFTRSMVSVLKRRAAIRIQGFWRTVFAKKRLHELLQAKRDHEIKTEKAAIMIQKRYRIRRARKLMHDMIEREKEAKRVRDQQRIEKQQEKMITLMGKQINVSNQKRKFIKYKNQINPFLKSKQEKSAKKIQKVWRGYRARKRVKKQRAEQNAILRKMRRDLVRNAALKMQARWRGIQARRQMERVRLEDAATKIQGLYRKRKARKHVFHLMAQTRAAKLIQGRWRGRLVRKMMATFREDKMKKVCAAQVMQGCARKYLYRQGKRKRLDLERHWAELRIQGLKKTEAARKMRANELFLTDVFRHEKNDGFKTITGDWTSLFLDVCGVNYEYYRKNNKPLSKVGLSGERFQKLIQQTPVLGTKLDRAKIDLMFSKAKAFNNNDGQQSPDKGGATTLGLIQFRRVFLEVATKVYLQENIDSMYSTFATEKELELSRALEKTSDLDQKRLLRQQHKETLKSEMTRIHEHTLTQFKYKKETGHRALILGLFDEYLWKAPWANVQKQKLLERAQEQIVKATVMIQRQYRGRLSRQFMLAFRERRFLEMERDREIAAVVKIQTQWRIYLAKREMVRRLKTVLQKCIDPDSGDPYWYNTKTDVSSWVKPKLLGSDDVEGSIVLPNRQDEYIVNCVKCHQETAVMACNDCADPFCEDCYRQEHHSFPTHTFEKISLCGECTYQAVTRYCEQCMKSYCCTCYEIVHECPEAKEAAPHKWKPLVKQCVECENRAVKWRCKSCGDDFCFACFKMIHRKGKRKAHQFHALPYLSVKMAEREDRLRRELEKEQERVRLEQWRKQKEQEQLELMVLRLQAIWRGRKDRAVGQRMLKDYRLRQRALWKQHKEDDKERGKLAHKLADFVGFAKVLETDDEETKQRKQMGWKGGIIGKVAVGMGAALPFGDELPGMVFIKDNTSLFLESTSDLRGLVKFGEFIRVENQYFRIMRVGLGKGHGHQPDEADQVEEDEAKQQLGEDDSTESDSIDSTKQSRRQKRKNLINMRRKNALTLEVRQRIEIDYAYFGPFKENQGHKAFFLGELSMAQEKLVQATRAAQEAKKGLQEKKQIAKNRITEYNLKDRLTTLKAKLKDEMADKLDDSGGGRIVRASILKMKNKLGMQKPTAKSNEDSDSDDEDDDEEEKKSIQTKFEPIQEQQLEQEEEYEPQESMSNGWAAFYDETTQTEYYYNSITGESTWEKPQELYY